MKNIEIKVVLNIYDDIDEQASEGIRENVEQAILHARNTCGIVPDEYESYIESMDVSILETN